MLKPIENITRFKLNVIKAFEAISRDNPLLRHFIYGAANRHSVFIVGGFLRSVANNEKPRDLDVIFNMSNEALENYIGSWNLPYLKNKFNGYKVDFKNIVSDIWTSETNWAFKDKVVGVGEEYLLSKVAQGTFFNYDSLVFDLKTERVNVTLYNECVRNDRLDIIRKDANYSQKNPGKITNVLRAFNIRQKSGLNFSDNLCRYLYDEFLTLGLCDRDKMVAYLKQVVANKRSVKYKELENEDTLCSSVDYILSILRANTLHQNNQLQLFA